MSSGTTKQSSDKVFYITMFILILVAAFFINKDIEKRSTSKPANIGTAAPASAPITVKPAKQTTPMVTPVAEHKPVQVVKQEPSAGKEPSAKQEQTPPGPAQKQLSKEEVKSLEDRLRALLKSVTPGKTATEQKAVAKPVVKEQAETIIVEEKTSPAEKTVTIVAEQKIAQEKPAPVKTDPQAAPTVQTYQSSAAATAQQDNPETAEQAPTRRRPPHARGFNPYAPRPQMYRYMNPDNYYPGNYNPNNYYPGPGPYAAPAFRYRNPNNRPQPYYPETNSGNL